MPGKHLLEHTLVDRVACESSMLPPEPLFIEAVEVVGRKCSEVVKPVRNIPSSAYSSYLPTPEEWSE